MFPTPTPNANVVRYRVFFRAPQPPAAAQNGDASHSVNAPDDRAFAESACALYAAFVARQVGDFIWHKHAMHLRVAPVDAPELRAFCLEGETSVGDAIDDEWVVTWLLFQLTTQFPDHDAIAQISDTDGEFLLIECADVLPEWVSPENSNDRVFVRKGELHLVDVDAVPELSDAVELRAAVGKTRTNKKKRRQETKETERQRVFQQSVRAVLDDAVVTRANVAMQRTLQQKLAEAPRYIRANRHRVRCLLPPKATRVLAACPCVVGAAVEAFYYREPKEAAAVCSQMKAFPPQDASAKIVTMSRCQYAQLKQQFFFPPKPFLHLPGVEGMKANDDNRNGSPQTRAAEIGVKLTCGLELLYATDECDQFGAPWRQIIDEALASGTAVDSSESTAGNDVEDDDAWLYVHPDSLEEKLQSVAMRTTQGTTQEDDIVGGAEELQNIATMFNNFMGGVSGVDGVESSEPVQLDMGAFMKLLNGEVGGGLGGAVDDDDEWDDPSDDDDDDGDESSIDSDDELDQEPEDEEDRIMREAMDEMDAELAGSTLSKTFTRPSIAALDDADAAGHTKGQRANRSVDVPDEDTPLDLDFNLLSNLLESMASQEGLAGPVSNILSELSASSSR